MVSRTWSNVKFKKKDEIRIYKNPDGEIRWTRTTKGNHKIVGASTQGYNSVRAAMANIKRTQKGPYDLVNELA